MKKPVAYINVSPTAYLKLGFLGSTAALGLTDNEHFVHPPIKPEVLKQAAQDVILASSKWGTPKHRRGSSADLQDLRMKTKNLLYMLRTTVKYVNTTAKTEYKHDLLRMAYVISTSRLPMKYLKVK